MTKALYIIGLSTLIVSCTSQKRSTVRKAPPKTSSVPKTQTKNPVTATPAKPGLTVSHGVEFYTQNIGDITKNDNTMSHGSIVSARPAGYNVVKTHFPAVAQNFRQKYVILHYTALDEDKSKTVLTQQAVSSHYLVNATGDNEIYQLVDENKRAYHAGISAWRKDKNLNDTSIGIEIVNTGFTTDASGARIFVPYDELQLKKVAALAKDIVNRYQIPPTNVLGHSDVAPTRKQDPGPLFPWKRLYDEYQIGMWYDDAAMMNFMTITTPESFITEQNSSTFIMKVQAMLQQFGYDIIPTGTWNSENRKVVEAFQYHFRPQKSDGIVDMETWAILQALLQKYPQK
ncbi:N-acetylmuramoyl-L-alanine amidase [Marnyiella aurantia]|uniref:N-acetylmuramoyl-L-alanine amidase n=1 Tax=Marnyiella aurantia TaxID=2758037 RepID=A0A7D7QY31_9FLAO|nr:N-acetylmuramoyl-L-alanine amidase [Marnyiella aurantia]MBA5246613.1 N-acetylmuramoyl-L-alanine amidase [Marnyiella aurantia]QMS98031.1 N-acetylmuramoyl-L-alanine amidase [Marnyiella aurantia]